MNKFIPLEKMSKKVRLELMQSRRGSWGALNPVTRKPENSKAYNRKKARREETFFDGGFYIWHPWCMNSYLQASANNSILF